MTVTGAGSLICMRSGTSVLHAASFMMHNIVFKHPVALLYLLYTYISVLSETYYNVTFLPQYMFRLYTAVGTFHMCRYQATNTQFISVETKQ
jgi:hypothetical protein